MPRKPKNEPEAEQPVVEQPVVEQPVVEQPVVKAGPSFQVIRGRAIRVATKAVAAKAEVQTKEIEVLDTHKTSGNETVWTYNVLLGLKEREDRFLIETSVELQGAATIVTITKTTKDTRV